VIILIAGVHYCALVNDLVKFFELVETSIKYSTK